MSGLLWSCFAVSGAAALGLELLWMRSAGLVLGATATTAAVVLAGYFGGLGLGAALARRAARQPVARYGLLELGAAAGTLWSIGIFRLLAAGGASQGLATVAVILGLLKIGGDSGSTTTSHPAPIQAPLRGATPADEARNLSAWLRAHSR